MVYASVGYKPIFGYPVDPRLSRAFETQMSSFERAMALGAVPAERLNVQLDGHQLVVFFLRAAGAGPGEKRPVILMTFGYDASVSDMYFAMGRQAVARGYHVVLVDGPGQGALLIRDNLPLIPDWERVVRAVVDVVVARPDIDEARIVQQGWSLGGHLALRAATGEPGSRRSSRTRRPGRSSPLSHRPPRRWACRRKPSPSSRRSRTRMRPRPRRP